VSLLVPLGPLDVWPLCHSMYARQKKLGKPTDGVRRLSVIDGPYNAPELRDWAILKNMISRCRKLLDRATPNVEVHAVDVEMMDPGASLPWTPGKDGEIEAHIGVVTNPFARICA
jgi:hypothetical protein